MLRKGHLQCVPTYQSQRRVRERANMYAAMTVGGIIMRRKGHSVS